MSFSSDFAMGALAVAGAGAVYKVWQLLQSPSVNDVEVFCKKPMKQMGDDDKVTVWGFTEEGKYVNWKDGISDESPFVSRVEAYLRLVDQKYEKKVSMGASENPRGKVPFANLKGLMVDDSAKIIDGIRNTFNITVDDHLSEQQKATGYLMRQLLFGSLYWVLLHQKFGTDHGRKMFSESLSKAMPPVICTFVAAMVFRANHANLHGCGVGRMPRAEIVKKGEQDVRTLSELLGEKQFFFGDKPTSYDSDVYCFLVVLFYDVVNANEPWVVDIQKECPNLVEHAARMKKLLYPEIE